MKDLVSLLLEPGTLIALVGASNDPSKYGYIIYGDLKSKGIRVVAVNPNQQTVQGDPCYFSLKALSKRPDIVNFVTPPEATLDVLGDCLALGLTDVWLQPGASDGKVVSYLENNGFNFLVNRCTMAESGRALM
jgi:predicted CoA-binding protein